MKHPPLVSVLLSAAGLLIAGCNVVPPPQADTTRYFVLTGSGPAPGPAAGSLRLGLRNVELAAYLNTRDMVLRSGSNELVLQEYARWAEPLDAAIARILRTELAAAPAVGRVDLQPFRFDTDRDYDVSVTVIHCEGETSARLISHPTARFAAVAEITSTGPNPRVVARRMYTAPESAWDGHDYARLAGLLGDDVAEFGRQIIADLPAAEKTAAESHP